MPRAATAAWLVLGIVPATALAGVRGSVVNGTDGRPAAGVALTLSSFRDGMTPMEETVTAADGTFEFTRDLPEVAARQPFAGAVRAELDGVYYTEILASDADPERVRIVVYSASGIGIPPPRDRVVILEVEDGRMSVRESFVIANNSEPPVTYSSGDGTLLFHLPEGAAGQVAVSGTGPAGMPLRSSALPTGDGDIHKVDFPLKPGENILNLQYELPHGDGDTYALRSLYSGTQTRLAVPQGVTVTGEGVRELSEHPDTRALIYSVSPEGTIDLTVSGSGRLASTRRAETEGGQVTIEPAPVAAELAWLSGLSVLILGLGFAHLMRSRVSGGERKQRRPA